jgi:hypothetical protein
MRTWVIRICLALAALLVALLIGLAVPIPAQAGASGYSDKKCLAEAMYYEARDQGWRGMLAVGIVIQNRVRDSRYPETACGVVRQGKYRKRKPRQTQMPVFILL